MSQEPGKSEESRKRKRERDPNQIRVNTSNSQVKWWMVKGLILICLQHMI